MANVVHLLIVILTAFLFHRCNAFWSLPAATSDALTSNSNSAKNTICNWYNLIPTSTPTGMLQGNPRGGNQMVWNRPSQYPLMGFYNPINTLRRQPNVQLIQVKRAGNHDYAASEPGYYDDDGQEFLEDEDDATEDESPIYRMPTGSGPNVVHRIYNPLGRPMGAVLPSAVRGNAMPTSSNVAADPCSVCATYRRVFDLLFG